MHKMSMGVSSSALTSPFFVPIDPQQSYVTLLLHFNGADGANTIGSFVDSSTYNTAVSSMATPNPALIAATKKFGTTSADFRSGGRLYYPPAKGQFGTSDWTIEGWANSAAVTGDRCFAFGQCGPAGTSSPMTLMRTTTDTLVASFTDAAGTVVQIIHSLIPSGWFHFALCRGASTLYFFVDGTLVGTQAITMGMYVDNSNSFAIGGLGAYIPGATGVGGTYGTAWKGYIDDFRITNGYCRYTSAFTVPTAEFPNPA